MIFPGPEVPGPEKWFRGSQQLWLGRELARSEVDSSAAIINAETRFDRGLVRNRVVSFVCASLSVRAKERALY